MVKSSQVRPLGASSCLLKGADRILEKCEDAEQLLMLHPLQSSIELNCFMDLWLVVSILGSQLSTGRD